jgi:hypothetical protein
MLLPIARVAVAAITGSFVYNTGRNVYETIQCTRSMKQIHTGNHHEQSTIPTIVSTTTPNTELSDDPIFSTSSDPQQQSILESLQSMSRQQLLDVYLNHCTIIPTDTSSSILDGEWNGILLNNNGLVSVCVCTKNKK